MHKNSINFSSLRRLVCKIIYYFRKDKIKLNLPFDQTKKEASSVLENLGKAIADVNNEISNGSDNNISIKKKIHDSKCLSPVGSLSGKELPS